jgi:hypothetical protein
MLQKLPLCVFECWRENNESNQQQQGMKQGSQRKLCVYVNRVDASFICHWIILIQLALTAAAVVSNRMNLPNGGMNAYTQNEMRKKS